MLRERPRLVGELADLLGISQPGVSKQLKLLREVGLVSVRRDAQRRWYDLRPDPLNEVEDWLAPYRQRQESRFERLDKLLDELKKEENPHDEA